MSCCAACCVFYTTTRKLAKTHAEVRDRVNNSFAMLLMLQADIGYHSHLPSGESKAFLSTYGQFQYFQYWTCLLEIEFWDKLHTNCVKNVSLVGKTRLVKKAAVTSVKKKKSKTFDSALCCLGYRFLILALQFDI